MPSMCRLVSGSASSPRPLLAPLQAPRSTAPSAQHHHHQPAQLHHRRSITSTASPAQLHHQHSSTTSIASPAQHHHQHSIITTSTSPPAHLHQPSSTTSPAPPRSAPLRAPRPRAASPGGAARRLRGQTKATAPAMHYSSSRGNVTSRGGHLAGPAPPAAAATERPGGSPRRVPPWGHRFPRGTGDGGGGIRRGMPNFSA